MNSQEMETAVRLKLHIVVIILRDDAYGLIKWKQASMKFANYGLDYGNPDFVAYAEAYGAKGWRVGSTAWSCSHRWAQPRQRGSMPYSHPYSPCAFTRAP